MIPKRLFAIAVNLLAGLHCVRCRPVGPRWILCCDHYARLQLTLCTQHCHDLSVIPATSCKFRHATVWKAAIDWTVWSRSRIGIGPLCQYSFCDREIWLPLASVNKHDHGFTWRVTYILLICQVKWRWAKRTRRQSSAQLTWSIAVGGRFVAAVAA